MVNGSLCWNSPTDWTVWCSINTQSEFVNSTQGWTPRCPVFRCCALSLDFLSLLPLWLTFYACILVIRFNIHTCTSSATFSVKGANFDYTGRLNTIVNEKYLWVWGNIYTLPLRRGCELCMTEILSVQCVSESLHTSGIRWALGSWWSVCTNNTITKCTG